MKKHCLISAFVLIAWLVAGQETKNLAEKLGYPKDAKLLIIHGDDIGLSQSTNSAYYKAFESGGLTTGSVMVPCPWFPDAAEYIKNHHDLDIGVHLTLTAEWKYFKWGGTAPSCEIPSLLDQHLHFFASVEELMKTVVPAEAEKEFRSQIEKAIAAGINPSHLDTHMGSAVYIPRLIPVYLKLAREYKLPYLLPKMYFPLLPAEVKKLISPGDVLLDNLVMISPAEISGRWMDPYLKALREMKPGLNEIIVHLSYDNPEMQAIAIDHEDFGSSWRQNDLETILSAEFRNAIRENGIILVTWKKIQAAVYPETVK